MLDRDLRVGQTIRIRRVGANKEALARVVGCYRDHPSTGRVFGVAFCDTESNLWDIVFPPAAALADAVLHPLLRCVACGRLEVSYLNEFESDLFSITTASRACVTSAAAGPPGRVLMEPFPQLPRPPLAAAWRNWTPKMLGCRT